LGFFFSFVPLSLEAISRSSHSEPPPAYRTAVRKREFPDAKVVKALNIVSAPVMVDPGSVAGGDHHMLIAGNDDGAKAEVTRILREWFGWKHVLDVGDITAARGLESYVILWVRVMMTLGTVAFNVKIAQ
jgi:hypothetical protein